MTDARAVLTAICLTEQVQEPLRLCLRHTASTETPLPAGVVPSVLLDTGTALPRLEGPATEAAGPAATRLQVPVLPIDPAADALVDSLVAARVQGTAKKRRLPRR